MLEVSDLQVRFGNGPAVVQGLSFSVPTGEAFGLVGESGCGKSTVLRALAGLNTDYSGDVRIDGAEVLPARDKHFYSKVQMVFQDPYASLHPRHSIGAQLIEPLRNQKRPYSRAMVSEALRNVSLSEQLQFRYPHQLSGGQRQRVAIARALILEPTLLLLDEPTSALDVSVQAEVLNLLDQLRRERGLTYVLVSHDLAVIAHMCTRIGVMEGGKLIEETDAKRLRKGELNHPYSRKLWAGSTTYGEKQSSEADGSSA